MIKRLIHSVITSRRKEVPFIIFFWFLLTFAISRLYVYAVHTDIIPNMYLDVKGIHVHHLNYGIAILSILGFISIAFQTFTTRYIHKIAALFGIGLGLAYDEFSLWLLLEDNYWARYSYDAVLVISLILLNVIYFKGFWLYLVRKTRLHKIRQLRLFRR